MIKRARNITFPNIGMVKGSRVWRNSETGVEIIKGANFAEVGLYYVCVPTQDGTGRVVMSTQKTLKSARSNATGKVLWMRDKIANAYLNAYEQEARASMNPHYVVTFS